MKFQAQFMIKEIQIQFQAFVQNLCARVGSCVINVPVKEEKFKFNPIIPVKESLVISSRARKSVSSLPQANFNS